LLKGARTILAKQGAQVRYNTTGNPGMGSGGMGDALTGVVAALLARGLSPLDAGSVAAWVCGRAAEAYVFGPLGSPESLTASQVIEHLGAGFRAIVSD
jgi:NAD(P)H-hydrate epimerase